MPLLDSLISVLAPHICVNCGREGKLVCDYCLPDAFTALPSRCYRCKRLTLDFAVCDKCKNASRPKHVWISTFYEGIAKQLLQAFKFERAQTGSKIIANHMDEVLPYLDQTYLIVPVPTATSRVRQRGYDQSVLLAKIIAQNRQLQYARAVTHLFQTRQVGASRQKRLDQLKNSFVVTNPQIVVGRKILIVDDVVTTGASLEAMTGALKNAGAKSVDALAFAQK